MEKNLPISVTQGIEPLEDWSHISTPEQLLAEISKRLFVKAVIDSDSVVISDKVPTSGDRSKIWIKTSKPYGIGKLIEGSYKMLYFNGHPVGTPFLASDSFMSPLTENVRKLSEQEVIDYGLPKLQNEDKDKVKNRHSYYIFEPKEISYN